MKHYIFLLIFLVGTSTAQAQTVNYFNKTFKPDTMNILSPAILALENGGYLVAHTYNTLNNYEGFAIRRIGSTGETEWFKHLDYGQEEHLMIGGGVLCTTPDGFFMLVGSKGAAPLVYGGNRDILMIKFDIEGNILWSTTNGDPDKIENAYHITPTQDGGYIMCGIQRSFTSSNRFYVIKTDAFGNKEWDRMYNPTQHGAAFSVHEIGNGYLIGGYIVNAGSDTDMYVIRIDKEGNLIWDKSYGTPESDSACFLTPSHNNTFIMAASIKELGVRKLYLSRIDMDGNIQGSPVIFQLPNVVTFQIHVLSDSNNYSITGISSFMNDAGGTEPYLLRFDNDFSLLWQRRLSVSAPHENWYLT